MRQFVCKMIVVFGLLVNGVAVAGGAATGGATEFTQIANNVQLGDAYAQQALQYQNQLLRYQQMITNLAKNPLGVTLPNLDQLATN